MALCPGGDFSCMSLWTGVNLAATLMHAKSSIYNSAFSKRNKHNTTWHMDLERFAELQTATVFLLALKSLIRHVKYIYLSSYCAAVSRIYQVSWASAMYYWHVKPARFVYRCGCLGMVSLLCFPSRTSNLSLSPSHLSHLMRHGHIVFQIEYHHNPTES